MDNKMIAAIAVVAVVAIAGVAAFMIMNQDKDSGDSLAYFDGVGLKVLGNVDKDNDIDQADYNAVKKLIDDGKSAKDNKLADANNDGVLDDKDLIVINNVIKGNKETIWHINYYDIDGNGTMDKVLDSTVVPVTSAMMTASANTLMYFDLLDIKAGELVKAAAYGSTNDKTLYGKTYLNKDLVTKVGGNSATSIPYEDDEQGSAQVIKEKNITCLVTDWNRSYIENWQTYESVGVDVVRIATASFEKEVYTHSLMLMGLIFGVEEQANTILGIYDQTREEIEDAISALGKDKIRNAVASSMTGSVSSGESDYTAVVEAAGAKFALEGYDFGGSASIYIEPDNLAIFDTRQYKIDNIVHLRTALCYDSTAAQVADYWAEYANAMSLWEHVYDGQVLISGVIPVPARVAYTAYAIYNDIAPELSEQWAKDILASFEAYYDADISKANKTLALTSYKYTVTISDDVLVTDMNGKEVASGEKFAYGTVLNIKERVHSDSKTLVVSGSSIDKGKFTVINNINAQYIENSVLEALNKVADELVKAYNGKAYMQEAVANVEKPGAVHFVNEYYNHTDKSYDLYFEYYETVEEAKAAFDAYAAKVTPKSSYDFDASEIIGSTEDNDFCIRYSGSHTDGKDYSGSTVYMTAYYKNIVLYNNAPTYFSYYTFDESLYDKSKEEVLAYFTSELTVCIQAMEDAMKAAFA